MEISQELIQELNHIRHWDLAERLTPEEVESILAEKINGMIRDDFNGLVQLLYRIDVEEPRLRYLLQQHKGEDAGKIIAHLIIDRLLKKIETRRKYSAKHNDGRPSDNEPSARSEDIPDGERW
jgi:hypothetical protein